MFLSFFNHTKHEKKTIMVDSNSQHTLIYRPFVWDMHLKNIKTRARLNLMYWKSNECILVYYWK